jgi:hypothetical protein
MPIISSGSQFEILVSQLFYSPTPPSLNLITTT